jgi:ribosomal protein S18 acetylase RimI-like enzyme
MTISVRRAQARDLARVGDLTAQAYLADGLVRAEQDYVHELRDAVRRAEHATVLVAEEEGGLLGTVTVAPHGSPYAEVAQEGESELRMLAVDPEARGRGLGERLTRAGIEAGLAGGARRIVLSTTPAMEKAQRMYERIGLQRVPERDVVVEGETLLVYVTEQQD